MSLKRNYSIDVFRIYSMFMICLGHVISHGGIRNELADFYGTKWYLVSFFEAISCVGVNCFGLISGYVGISTEFKYSRILKLWTKIVFYSFIISIIVYFINPDLRNQISILKSIFPIILGNGYWYCRAYLVMSIFIPFFNYIIKNKENIHCEKYIIFLFIAFCVLTWVPYNSSLFTRLKNIVNFGFSASWLSFLYILGAYIKIKMNNGYLNTKLISDKSQKMLPVIILLLFVMLTWILAAFYHIRVQFNYNSPTALIIAVCSLILFTRIKINDKLKKVISIITPSVFSVYLIHDHNIIERFYLHNTFVKLCKLNDMYFFISIMTSTIIIFIICIIIDLCRIKILNKIISFKA